VALAVVPHATATILPNLLLATHQGDQPRAPQQAVRGDGPSAIWPVL